MHEIIDRSGPACNSPKENKMRERPILQGDLLTLGVVGARVAASVLLCVGLLACGSDPTTQEPRDLAESSAEAKRMAGEDQDEFEDQEGTEDQDDEAGSRPGRRRGKGNGHQKRDAGTADASDVAADAGVVSADAGPGTSTDGGGSSPADGGVAPPGPTDAGSSGTGGAPCVDQVATQNSGHHRAGESCSNCHTGRGAPLWTLSGTLFSGISSSTPVPGATIQVTDAAGKRVSLVSALNGNFWTTAALTFPVMVSVSRCPDTAEMIGSVSAPASCNSCHSAGFRVHLP